MDMQQCLQSTVCTMCTRVRLSIDLTVITAGRCSPARHTPARHTPARRSPARRLPARLLPARRSLSGPPRSSLPVARPARSRWPRRCARSAREVRSVSSVATSSAGMRWACEASTQACVVSAGRVAGRAREDAGLFRAAGTEQLQHKGSRGSRNCERGHRAVGRAHRRLPCRKK